MATPRKPNARRGRPPKFRLETEVLLPLVQVAEIPDLNAAHLAKCLDVTAASFFVGAQKQRGQWYVPAHSLRPWMLSGVYPLLTPTEAARALSISRSEMITLLETKRLPHVRLPGRKFRIRPKDLAAVLRTVPAASFFTGGNSDV